MVAKISQTLRFKPSITPQDITVARTGAFIDVTGAQRLLVSFNVAPVAAGKKVTIKLIQAKDSAGTGAKDLTTAFDVPAPAGGGSLAPMIDTQIVDLDSGSGYGFVAAYALSDNALPVYGSASVILAGNRYNPA